MLRTRFAAIVAVAGLFLALAGWSLTVTPGSAAAQVPPIPEPKPANQAAEACRQFDEAGLLAALGVTRGECVNLHKGPVSENANNFIAAACSTPTGLTLTGTTNKGQCIKVLRERLGLG